MTTMGAYGCSDSSSFLVFVHDPLDIPRTQWERKKQSITPLMPMRETNLRSRKKRREGKVAGRSVVSRGMVARCTRLSAAAVRCGCVCGTNKEIGKFS
jgi:hypothetical protein